MTMIKEYNSVKVKSTDAKIKIILTDETPVLPITEQIIVEKQIQWLEQGIIKPSCSDFASPNRTV